MFYNFVDVVIRALKREVNTPEFIFQKLRRFPSNYLLIINELPVLIFIEKTHSVSCSTP